MQYARRFIHGPAAGGSANALTPLAAAVTRPVANRTKQTYINTHLSDGTNKFGVYRSRHRIFPGWDCLGGFQVWYANRSSESAGNAAITVSAEYEYPAFSGTWVSLRWGGSTSIVIATTDLDQPTDAIAVNMPGGTELRIRSHVSVATTGQKWPVLDTISLAAASGEGFALSTTADPGDPANSDCTEFYGPVAITGLSKAPFAVGVFSDSIGQGAQDSLTGNTIGFIQRIVGTLPVIQFSTSGETLANFVTTATNTKRFALADQCGLTRGILAYGTNDSKTLATLQKNYSAAMGLLNVRGLSVTVLPVLTSTTSTNSFIAASDQTPGAGYTVGGVIDQFNTWLQTRVGQGADLFFDTRPGFQDAANKILTTGVAFGYTADGLHPNIVGNASIASLTTTTGLAPYSLKTAARSYLGWNTLKLLFDATGESTLASVTTEANKIVGNGDLTPGSGVTSLTTRGKAPQLNSASLGFTRSGTSDTSVLVAASTDAASTMMQGTNLDYTFLIAFEQTAAAVSFIAGWSAPVDASNTHQCMLIFRSGLAATWRYGKTGDTNLEVTLPTLAVNTLYVVAIKHSAGKTDAWINSTTKFLSAATQAPGNAFPSTAQFTIGDSVLFGATPAFNVSGFGGNVFAVAAANSARSDAEIQQAITDFAVLFGAQLS